MVASETVAGLWRLSSLCNGDILLGLAGHCTMLAAPADVAANRPECLAIVRELGHCGRVCLACPQLAPGWP